MSRDAGDALRIALCQAFSQFEGGLRMTVSEIVSEPWQSNTFDGHRHRATLRLEGPSAARIADEFVAGLDEREFELRGHHLVEILAVGQTGGFGTQEIALYARTVAAA